MTKQLNLDEMLWTLKFMESPLFDAFKGALEGIGSAMAAVIGKDLGVGYGAAHSEEPEFAGTCAGFWGLYAGQPCPEPLTAYDEGEWDCEDGPQPTPTKPPRIGVTLEGGLIQSVFSDAPDGCPVVYVIDHDTDGADDSELTELPSYGTRAIVNEWTPQAAESAEWFDALAAAEPGVFEDEDPMCDCSNCSFTGRESTLKPIKDLHQRVAPGEPMPSGECPECGALCHEVEAEG